MNAFILKKPIVTEKAYGLIQKQNAYTFEVALDATKGQVREAVEQTFGVKVIDVQTVHVAGKNKRTGKRRTTTRQPDKKKAIVTLAKDQKIEMFNLETK